MIGQLSQLVTAEGGHSIIYSTDKDFLQLVSESVKVYNPVKKKTFDVDVVLEEYGIHPKHFYFYRALDGDNSDNIEGIKGVGQATLKKYVPEIIDPSIDINLQFIENKYVDVKKLPKVISNILDNRDIVERNIQLMNLHEGMMSPDARMKVVHKFHDTTTSFHKYDLMYRDWEQIGRASCRERV